MSKEFKYPQSVLESDNYSYKDRHWRAPTIKNDEEILFDEPGRVLRGSGACDTDICCRSLANILDELIREVRLLEMRVYTTPPTPTPPTPPPTPPTPLVLKCSPNAPI